MTTSVKLYRNTADDLTSQTHQDNRMKTKWVFGYRGAREIYWLMATSYRNLVNQLDAKGMTAPDWYENTGNRS